ncbi:MAG: hydantoinase/oxoprolinase family protein [Anaerolineae bacterium]
MILIIFWWAQEAQPGLGRASPQASVWPNFGVDLIEVAAAVYDIINAKMSDLIRSVYSGTGFLPQHLAYCWRAGAIHAVEFARPLGISRLYIFPYRLSSAFGVACTQRHSPHPQHLAPAAFTRRPEQLNHVLADLEATLKGDGPRGVPRAGAAHLPWRCRKQVNELALEARPSVTGIRSRCGDCGGFWAEV